MGGSVTWEVMSWKRADPSDHFLQAFECRELHDILGWLRCKPLLFTRERVRAEATLGRWLAVLANLQESWNGEGAWSTSTNILADDVGHRLEHGGDLFATQASFLGNATVDLALSAGLDLGS